MAHYMRYIATDTREITLELLETALQAVDPFYHLECEANFAKFMYGDATYGRMSVSRPGDEEFAEEIQDLRAALKDIPYAESKAARKVFKFAETLVVLQVIWESRDDESTLERIQPLWRWLLENRVGLLQVDNAGYYGLHGLVVAMR
jgi:hypothetical protein